MWKRWECPTVRWRQEHALLCSDELDKLKPQKLEYTILPRSLCLGGDVWMLICYRIEQGYQKEWNTLQYFFSCWERDSKLKKRSSRCLHVHAFVNGWHIHYWRWTSETLDHQQTVRFCCSYHNKLRKLLMNTKTEGVPKCSLEEFQTWEEVSQKREYQKKRVNGGMNNH